MNGRPAFGRLLINWRSSTRLLLNPLNTYHGTRPWHKCSKQQNLGEVNQCFTNFFQICCFVLPIIFLQPNTVYHIFTYSRGIFPTTTLGLAVEPLLPSPNDYTRYRSGVAVPSTYLCCYIKLGWSVPVNFSISKNLLDRLAWKFTGIFLTHLINT